MRFKKAGELRMSEDSSEGRAASLCSGSASGAASSVDSKRSVCGAWRRGEMEWDGGEMNPSAVRRGRASNSFPRAVMVSLL